MRAASQSSRSIGVTTDFLNHLIIAPVEEKKKGVERRRRRRKE